MAEKNDRVLKGIGEKMNKKILILLIVVFWGPLANTGSGHNGDYILWPGNVDTHRCWDSHLSRSEEIRIFKERVMQVHDSDIESGRAKAFTEDKEQQERRFGEFKVEPGESIAGVGWEQLGLSVEVMETKRGAKSWEYYKYIYYLSYSNPFAMDLRNGKNSEGFHDTDYGLEGYLKQLEQGYDFFVDSCSEVSPVRFFRIFFESTSLPGKTQNLEL